LPRLADPEKPTTAFGHQISTLGRASIAGAAVSFSRSAYFARCEWSMVVSDRNDE
jgi:hypothetical protein